MGCVAKVLSVMRKVSDVTITKPQQGTPDAKSDCDWTVTVVKQRNLKPTEQKFLAVPEVPVHPQKAPESGGIKLRLRTLQKKQLVPINVQKAPPKNKQADLKKHLQNLTMILSHSNATPFGHRGGLGYTCVFCPQQYAIPADLKAHTLATHNYQDIKKNMKYYTFERFVVKFDVTGLQCTICENSINGIENLIPHLRGHGKEVFTDIKSHFIPFKFDKNEFYCIHCLKTFDHFKVAYQHMSEHYRNYECDLCGMPFVTEQNFRCHTRGHSTGEFKCNYCPKVFDTYGKKMTHHNKLHLNDGKRHKCPHCNMRFKGNYNKVQHMVKEHGVEPVVYQCKACDRNFNSKPVLLRHTKRNHLMERRFECSDCNLKFFDKRTLEDHITKHTGEKNYRCDVCLKTYARSRTLREHLRIHADDRRFKCELCGQTFVQKCSLKGHMKSKHERIF